MGEGLCASLGVLLVKRAFSGTAVLISQREIWKPWQEVIKKTFSQVELPLKVFLSPGGPRSELSKTTRVLLETIRLLARVDQRGLGIFIVALGGGAVGDLAGFAASIYRRGIPYVQVPTTLTAQVDSAIGGKTALDLPEGKNLLGTIYQPRLVILDPAFLGSLSDALFAEGLAEVVKYGVIGGGRFLRHLEENHSRILRREIKYLLKVIQACVRFKARIVSRDEFDKRDTRIVLNFGHTFAHAIEAAVSYRGYSHGEAVSMGMVMAMRLSHVLGILKEPDLMSRVESLLSNLGLPVVLKRQVKTSAILNKMRFDKKRRNGVMRFVLIERAGKTVVVNDVSTDLIREVIESGRETP